jgi:Tol biopolymer transport system component
LGGASQRLLTDVGSPVSFSPDGKRFAFVREYPQQGESAIVIANADGTGQRKLAAYKYPEGFTEGPSWSPDGQFIASAVVLRDADGVYDNVIGVRVEDGTQVTLAAQRWRWIKQVAWLPDGSGLLMTARDREAVPGSPTQVWHVSYPGGAARRVTNDLGGYETLSLTAASDALVTVQVKTQSQIMVAPDADAGRARQITPDQSAGDLSWLSWTGDGRIVYVSRASGNPDLWVVDSDGGNQRQLTFDPATDMSPAVAADDRYIFFFSYRSGDQHLWRADIDGGNPVQLTNAPPAGNGNVDCSPDGQWVVYQSGAFGKQVLSRVSVAGGEPVRLTDAASLFPAVAPDGQRIACLYHDERADAKWRQAVIPFADRKSVE